MQGERKLLVIGYVWPEPNSSAAGRNMLSLVQLFRSHGWLVDFASPAILGEHIYDLSQDQVGQHEIALNCSSFDDFVLKLQPDVVLFDRFMMEEQFGWRVAKSCPQAVRVLDMEDLHSLRQARHEAVKKGVDTIEYGTELAMREVASIFRSDLSLVISEYERDLLISQYEVPEFLLEHCPFMVDSAEGNLSGYEEREHFISIGNFRHAPNWDAVLQLKQSIWPLIRQKLPHTELHIYGAYPPPKATQLHNEKEGFLVKGWTPDANEVMSKARVCLAPLRFGAGLKGKLVEAMLCQTPSVTTTIGGEGMRGNLPWPGVLVDDPEAFAAAAMKLYSDSEEWKQKCDLAPAILEQRFNKDEVGSRVLKKVEYLLEHLSQQRKKNFIGSMLQHHSMKSTQYMSQWIEAKNA